MPRRVVQLWSMPDEVMLLIEHPSGVVYQNQVGGNVCEQAEIEGVLVPLGMGRESFDDIMKAAYPTGSQGIPSATADEIDAILRAEPAVRSLRVDRHRLDSSWEAWVHVILEAPTSRGASSDSDVLEDWHGFGAVQGVLTWPNSD